MNSSSGHTKPKLNLATINAVYRDLSEGKGALTEGAIKKGRLGKVLSALVDNKGSWLTASQIKDIANVKYGSVKLILGHIESFYGLARVGMVKVKGNTNKDRKQGLAYTFIDDIEGDNLAEAILIIKKESQSLLSKTEVMTKRVRRIAVTNGYVVRSELIKRLECEATMLARVFTALVKDGLLVKGSKSGLYMLAKTH